MLPSQGGPYIFLRNKSKSSCCVPGAFTRGGVTETLRNLNGGFAGWLKSTLPSLQQVFLVCLASRTLSSFREQSWKIQELGLEAAPPHGVGTPVAQRQGPSPSHGGCRQLVMSWVDSDCLRVGSSGVSVVPILFPFFFFFVFSRRLRYFLVFFLALSPFNGDPFSVTCVHYGWEMFFMFQGGRKQTVFHRLERRRLWHEEFLLSREDPRARSCSGDKMAALGFIPGSTAGFCGSWDTISQGVIITVDFEKFWVIPLMYFSLFSLLQAFKPASPPNRRFLTVLRRHWLSGSKNPSSDLIYKCVYTFHVHLCCFLKCSWIVCAVFPFLCSFPSFSPPFWPSLISRSLFKSSTVMLFFVTSGQSENSLRKATHVSLFVTKKKKKDGKEKRSSWMPQKIDHTGWWKFD